MADDLPYKLHTNFELGMMLRREKPLAVFMDAYECFPETVQRYFQMFDRHVADGNFVKREYVIPDKSVQPRAMGWHTIMYALPEESWRIDAMINIRLSEEWSLEYEREEGRLLGYDDWQNDVWLSKFSNA